MKKNSYASILALIGAFSFAFFLGVAIHEFGHAIAIRSLGVRDVQVILHPFGSSSTIWNVNRNFLGYVDAAGPLFNVFLSCSILILLWTKRSQSILPLLLLGPMSLIQEGFSSLIQILLNIPGTDSVRIIASGVPSIIVFGVAILFMSLGIILFSFQLPLYDISPEDPILSKLSILIPGLSAYMILILLYALVFNPPGIIRGIILSIFSVFIAMIVAAVNKPLSQIYKHDNCLSVEIRSAMYSLASGGLALLVGLIMFNP